MSVFRYLATPNDVWAWARQLVTDLNRVVGQGSQAMPSGSVTDFAGVEVPLGWLLCDGSTLSAQTYPNLFVALGYTYGGSGDEFKLPDYRDRITIGAGSLVAFAAQGGSATATLTTDELPVHSHGVTDPTHTHVFTGSPHAHAVTDPGHAHAVTDPGHTHANGSSGAAAGAAAGATQGTGSTGSAVTGISVTPAPTGVLVVDATATGVNAATATGVTVDNAGGGESFSILNPVVGVRKIIKV